MTSLLLSRPGIPAPRLTPFLALRDFSGVAKRNLLRAIRSPQLLLYTVEPVMVLLIFRYIFSGAIKARDYTGFVVPAIFLITVLLGSMTSAIGIAEDLKSGMIDRFRSLPMARSAVLTGRSLTDLVRSIISLAVMVGLGVAVGFRFHSDAGPILLGMLLILAFGYSFSWMNTAVGIAVKDPESAQNATFGPVFFLIFASNAIVPASTLPGWLQGFARNQPLGVTTSAVRELLEGGAAAHDAWVSLAWSAGITVVFFLTSYALYQRAAAK
ncbi:MAG TPA: ABC transporter permease [Actinomycetota bacterium]|jgi:ABC-2 type transport system permease protein/oleandomycin transport system permease protein|nr:ABC transporter permease [Actinomycetota bacterium]